jgi:hypothetical protein
MGRVVADVGAWSRDTQGWNAARECWNGCEPNQRSICNRAQYDAVSIHSQR